MCMVVLYLVTCHTLVCYSLSFFYTSTNYLIMKTSSSIYAVIAIIILLGIGWFAYDRMDTVNQAETATTTEQGGVSSTTTPTPPTTTGGTKPTTGRLTYTNTTYGFEVEYPSYIRLENDFTSFHNLGNNWRINAPSGNQGKNIVAFPVYRVDQGGIATGKAYPLFYGAETRVGVSNNTAGCYTPDAGYTAQKVSDVTINGVTFKAFYSSGAGMQQSTEAVSYRTIRNNQCFVVEQLRTGSTYRDETMTPGLSDTTLASYYATAGDIAKSFKFTK